MNDRMIFSLDIGSSKLIALVGSIDNEIKIHGFSSYYFTNNKNFNELLMVVNGSVCDLSNLSSKVARTLNEAKINADCSYGGVITNISGNHLKNIYVRNSIKLQGDSINADTIRFLANGVQALNLTPDYEILDYEIQEYLLDEENYAINPLGLSCKTCCSNVNVFIAHSAQLKNNQKLFKSIPFNLEKIIPSGILSAMAVLNKEEKELGCCLIDIGAGTTDVIVYENGFIRYLLSIPVGGENITNDIANILKISRNWAEDIKITYSDCLYNPKHGTTDIISIIDHRGSSNNYSRKLLNEVILARISDILNLVRTRLIKQNIYDIINSGIVLTGGCSMLTNLQEFAENIFKLPTRIGLPNYQGELKQIINSPRFATAIGGLYFTQEYLLNQMNFNDKSDTGFNFNQLISKVKNMFSK